MFKKSKISLIERIAVGLVVVGLLVAIVVSAVAVAALIFERIYNIPVLATKATVAVIVIAVGVIVGVKLRKKTLSNTTDEQLKGIATNLEKIAKKVDLIELSKKEEKVADKFVWPRAIIVIVVMIIFLVVDLCILGYIVGYIIKIVAPNKFTSIQEIKFLFPDAQEIKYGFYFLITQLAIFSSGFGLANIPAMVERISVALGIGAKKKQEESKSISNTNSTDIIK